VAAVVVVVAVATRVYLKGRERRSQC